MKTCGSCGEPIEESVQEFGSIFNPICRGCYLSGSTLADDETDEKIAEIDEEIEDLKGEIEGHEQDIDDCEDQIRVLEKKKFELKNQVSDKKEYEKEKLERWRSGMPILVQ